MSDIKTTIKRLIKQGKQVEFTLQVKQYENDSTYYYLPDEELNKLLCAYPQYKRAGLTTYKFNGGKVFLPYYLTNGFFTTQENLLLPIKIIPTL